MARIKATCSKCEATILLFFDNESEDWKDISELKQGEMFEHKCPHCEQWSTFEIVEHRAQTSALFRSTKTKS